ncbi:MAG: SRPBCC family protein [Gemmatimonadales bacterium]
MALQFTIQEEFAAPPARVFAATTDFDAMRNWMPGFVGVDKLTAGPFSKGTKFRETRKMFGREATEHFEVTGYEAGKQVEFFVDGTKGSSRRGEYRFRYAFTPSAKGTTVTINGEISGMGKVGELIGRLLMGPVMKKAVGKDLAALRKYVEGGGAVTR